MVDGLVFISCRDGQPLLDGVEEVQDHWKRNFASFLADSLLKSGEGRCLPAFVLDGFLQRRPEIFDWLKGSDARRVGSLGNDFDLLLQEVQGIVCYVGAGQIHLPLIPSASNPICPKPCLPPTPFANIPTWKITALPSCNNGSSLFPKKPTQLALPPLGRLKIHGQL